MPKLRDQLHIRPSKGVTHRSPIEDQVQEVYVAAHKLAIAKGFKPYTHDGPHGPVKGLSGPMVLKQLVKQLFPGYDDVSFQTAYSIINQALRRTDGAVCIKQPRNAGFDQETGKPMNERDLPVWFIADKMPKNLVIVTTGVARKSADHSQEPAFSEDRFLTKREKRLHESEVERPASPVEVSFVVPGEKSDAARLREEALAAQRDRNRRAHEEFLERVLLEIQTQKQPVTALDLQTIINRDDQADWEKTTIRGALQKLEKRGVIVSRKETPEEALVRGGGHMPKATRPLLWWPAPGPVPQRTALPDGIQPARSAADIAQELSLRNRQQEDLVLAIMRTKGSKTEMPPRTVGRITELAEGRMTRDEIKGALHRLEQQGKVYKSETNGKWYLVENKRNESETQTPAADWSQENQTLPPAPEEVTVQTTPTAPPADDDNLRIVLDLADRLGVTLPKGDDGRVAELESERDELLQRNRKLEEQVKALKAAISALT